MGSRMVRVVDERFVTKRSTAHRQWLEQVGINKLRIFEFSFRFHQVCDQAKHNILVAVTFARGTHKINSIQPVDYPSVGHVFFDQVCVSMRHQSGRLGHEVLQANLTAISRLFELYMCQIRFQGCLPGERRFLNQDRSSCGSERFG